MEVLSNGQAIATSVAVIAAATYAVGHWRKANRAQGSSCSSSSAGVDDDNVAPRHPHRHVRYEPLTIAAFTGVLKSDVGILRHASKLNAVAQLHFTPAPPNVWFF